LRNFTPDLKQDYRYFISDFQDYRDFREYSDFRDYRPNFRDFRSGFRTFVRRIPEAVGPSSRGLSPEELF